MWGYIYVVAPRAPYKSCWWDLGLKSIIRRIWAPIGQKPIAVVEHRYEWLYLYGFVHPKTGRTEWFLIPRVNTQWFGAVLQAIAKALRVKILQLAVSPLLVLRHCFLPALLTVQHSVCTYQCTRRFLIGDRRLATAYENSLSKLPRNRSLYTCLDERLVRGSIRGLIRADLV